MKIEVQRGSGRILAFKRVLGGVWAALKSTQLSRRLHLATFHEVRFHVLSFVL